MYLHSWLDNRVVKTGWDDTGCGQWSYITFNGKENKHITMINAYRVCSHLDPGNTTSSKQQQCIQYADDELMPYGFPQTTVLGFDFFFYPHIS
jgi:hypothetical protein